MKTGGKRMKKNLKKLFESMNREGFLKSTLTLMSGSIIAQILAICISPIMTRLYSESEIGGYTLILTAVSMFGSVICGRYDLIIVSEEKEERVFPLVKLCFIITVVLSILVASGYSLYYATNNEMNLSPLFSFFWIFILLLFTGIGNILISFNNRNKEYKLMTSVNIIREVGRDICLVLGGICHIGIVGLLISQTVSVALGIKRQSRRLIKKAKEIIQCPFEDILECLKIYKKQLLYSVPATFANSFSYSVLNLFIGQLFGLKVLAYYSMSFRMLGLPLSLVGTNISKVFFENAAREYEAKKEFRSTFLKTSVLLLAVAVPMVVLLMIFAPWAFGFFFGEKWRVSGEYVRILAPMFGIRLIASALSPAMIVVNKQNFELVLQMSFIACAIVSYFIGSYAESVNVFLNVVAISFSIVYILYYFIMFTFCKSKEKY